MTFNFFGLLRLALCLQKPHDLPARQLWAEIMRLSAHSAFWLKIIELYNDVGELCATHEQEPSFIAHDGTETLSGA